MNYKIILPIVLRIIFLIFIIGYYYNIYIATIMVYANDQNKSKDAILIFKLLIILLWFIIPFYTLFYKNTTLINICFYFDLILLFGTIFMRGFYLPLTRKEEQGNPAYQVLSQQMYET